MNTDEILTMTFTDHEALAPNPDEVLAAIRGEITLDGAVIGTLTAPVGGARIDSEQVRASFELRMVEDGVNTTGIAKALTGIYDYLTNWAFPRAFQVYDLAAGSASGIGGRAV